MIIFICVLFTFYAISSPEQLFVDRKIRKNHTPVNYFGQLRRKLGVMVNVAYCLS